MPIRFRISSRNYILLWPEFYRLSSKMENITTGLISITSNICRRSLFQVPILVFVILSFSPNRLLAEKKTDATYHVVHYTTENGLPQNSAKHLAADNNGFLWITTESGLVRFDGHNFLVFNKQNTALQSNRLLHFVKKNKQLLALIDDRQWISIDNKSSLPGRVWPAFTDPSSPYYITSQQDTFYSNTLPDTYWNNRVIKKYNIPLENDSFYSCSADSVFLNHDKKRLATYQFHSSNPHNYLLLGSTLYVYEPGRGFYYLDKDHFLPVVISNPPENVLSRSSKIYWSLAGDQLFVYNNRSLYHLTAETSGHLEATEVFSDPDFVRKDINSIYYDVNSSTLFLGSSAHGLYRVKRKQFKVYERPGTNPQFYALCPLGDSSSILAESATIINVTDNKFPITVRPNGNDSAFRDRYSLVADHTNGDIWTKYWNVLYKIDGKSLRKKQQWMLPGVIELLFEDRDHQLLIFTGAGIYKLNYTDSKALPTLFLGQVRNATYIIQDKAGNYFIGLRTGLLRYSTTAKTIDTFHEFDNKIVRNIYISDDQSVWVTTYEDAISLIRQNTVTKLPMDPKGYLAYAHSILEDAKGYFWIPTNNGLFQAAKKDLLQFAVDKKTSVYYTRYDMRDGLLTNEFNGGSEPCGVYLKNGVLALPSINGIVCFNPMLTRPILPSQALFIYQVKNGRYNVLNDSLRLNRADNNLRLHISTPYFDSFENLQIEYQLITDGEEQAWRTVPDHGNINLERLPLGTSSLNFRKVNGFGQNNISLKSISIEVLPAWYETWWFRILVVILMLAKLVLYGAYRIRKVKKKNEQLEVHIKNRTLDLQNTLQALKTSEQKLQRHNEIQDNMIAVIAHDIKTPLSYMTLASQKMNGFLKTKEYGIIEEYNNSIYEYSSRIYSLIDGITTYMKLNLDFKAPAAESFDLNLMIEEKIALLAHKADLNGSSFHNVIPEEYYIISKKQELAIIIHNIMDNAAKNTANGFIKISIEQDNEQHQILIEDNGSGMPDEILYWLNDGFADAERNAKGGLGLLIVKKIANSIPVKVSAKAQPGKGTTISINILKQLAHLAKNS